MGNIRDKRKVTDRRIQIHSMPYNRRVRPDRRLNNISVEWIPLAEDKLHPAMRKLLDMPG
jgi:hypothetical protein